MTFPVAVRLDASSPDPTAPRLGQRLFTREGLLTLERGPLQWVRYDLSGRWRTARVQGATCRRALAGRVIAVRGYRCGGERFHDVEAVREDDARDLHECLRGWAAEALEAFGTRAGDPWAGVLERAVGMDPAELARDVESFHAAYQGDPITPPDHAESILLQSTVGCAHNACTFCLFYQGQRFSIRPQASFDRHVEDVRRFLGPTLRARHRVFFGDASGLMVKPALLARHFEAARALLDDRTPLAERSQATVGILYRPTHPFSTFCDTFLTPLPCPDDLRELEGRGLDRVYLGVESGCAELLGFLRKPASPEGMLDAVARLHGAGIRVTVIVMMGVGGRAWATRHVQDTIDLLRRMQLRAGDAVQFSEFFPTSGSVYETEADKAGIEPLPRLECRAQMRTIVEQLGLRSQPGGVRIQMYDARQLLY